MRTIVIVLSACLISAGSFAADQTSTGANSKLAAMLAAKDANGKPIISPEEQAYFSGLNDNLRALLDDLVEKEVITRPGALGNFARAAIASAKNGSALAEQMRSVSYRLGISISGEPLFCCNRFTPTGDAHASQGSRRGRSFSARHLLRRLSRR